MIELIELIGYIGIVILCSAIFVWLIIRNPDRNKWSLDSESEDLKETNKTQNNDRK